MATLCKFAAPAHVVNAEGRRRGGWIGEIVGASSGEDDRARTAAVTAFTVANRYGDGGSARDGATSWT